MIKFNLPFNGSWFTAWGGDTNELNQHHDNIAQIYAFDFVINHINNNSSYKNKGKNNKDYFCFEEEILAPADGEIVQVVNGVDDNKPGYLNGYYTPGNVIVIKHSNEVYSFLAHFKLNSIIVKVGDKVKSFDTLGLCGNSGRSSEPHLHFHLQNRANILFATGIKCFFLKINIKVGSINNIVNDYSPIKNDVISNLI